MFTVLIIFLLTLPFLLFIFSKWRYSYWKRKGVLQLEPEFFYGNIKKLLTAQFSLGYTYLELYEKFKKLKVRHGGIYRFFSPQYIPLDVEIVKCILQKDFVHFSGRGLYTHEKDLMTQTLFRMEGEPWKHLRAKLSPTFTSGKLKSMFDTLLNKIEGLEIMANDCVVAGEPINIKDVSARFTTDVIGSCAFGLECDSMRDGNCEFRINGNKIFAPRIFSQWVETLIPWKLLSYTGYRSFGDVREFFETIVTETIYYRSKNNVERKDFMQLLIQMKKSGQSNQLSKGETETIGLTNDEIIAQCFLFFSAGYETSASTMTFTLYELAKNPKIQNKVREEIKHKVNKNGKITYDALVEMTYMDKVIQETLRKYPPVSVIPRICTQNYKVPGTNVVIEKGTTVQIPVLGIHMDPDYYPDPGKYDPERFTEENKAKRPEFSWLGFGEGPRICIGLRFGMLQSKIGLVGLLRDYSFTLNENTPTPLVYQCGTFITQV
ncbi:probable cytochrome P450 6a23 isoform X2 [Cylas formicarius]|uniref:probable cytochrome P450 6a23 isoform X2 n=1 Tax=Cylas formicarius TaxID=197179 RepID=UPI0029588F75|nr:probable cytochrome P450 6a23 isoform X2 [Cylas formicarius]